MKSIGIITINAKYIHSSLSLRYLRNAARAAGHTDVWIQEFALGQPIWKISAEILKKKPKVLGIGIYIWNRAQSFELIERIKKQAPEIEIIIGGPEVSFDAPLTGEKPLYTLISGEGEKKWVEVLEHLQQQKQPSPETVQRWASYGEDLPSLEIPYFEEDLPELKNRIVYLETSRGCPYLCSFCLSALDRTVRYFNDDQTEQQIEFLLSGGVQQIKFVDRTFNLKPQRMKELIERLSKFQGASFHFEVVGDILTTELTDFLKTVPDGMFQFEIGIQTTTEEVQTTIQRKQNNEKLFTNLRRLIEMGTVHLHCDLIFGLPGETLTEILQSFEKIAKLKPHELQLGFLKFLPGAPVRKEIEEHQYQYQSSPPYEFISHKNLSATETLYLKNFAEIFELFYNSKRFTFSLNHLTATRSMVDIIDSLLTHMESRNQLMTPHSLENQYKIFHETFDIGKDILSFDLLRLDYLFAQRVFRLPVFLKQWDSNQKDEKFKTWPGDRQTPLIPFNHEIIYSENDLRMVPTPYPTHYAVTHSKKSEGYIQKPEIIKYAP